MTGESQARGNADAPEWRTPEAAKIAELIEAIPDPVVRKRVVRAVKALLRGYLGSPDEEEVIRKYRERAVKCCLMAVPLVLVVYLILAIFLGQLMGK